MSTYQGTLKLRATGTVEGSGLGFVTEVTALVRLSVPALLRETWLTGSFFLEGAAVTTLTDAAGGVTLSERALLGGAGGSPVVLDELGLLLPGFGYDDGYAWTGNASFNADRSELRYSGAGAYDGYVADRVEHGSFDASLTLAMADHTYDIDATVLVQDEGDEGATPFAFLVTRHGPSDVTSAVSWRVEAGSNRDFYADVFFDGIYPSGRLEFAPGETQKLLTIAVAGNRVQQADTEFVVRLDYSAQPIVPLNLVGRAIIRNDDTQALLSLSSAEIVLDEGDSGTTAFEFHVVRTGNTESATTFSYVMSPLAPHRAGDGDFAPGTKTVLAVTMAPGQTEYTLRFDVVGDTEAEPDERFRVELFNPGRGAVLGRSVATGTIRGDDAIVDLSVISAVTGLALPATPQFYYGPVEFIAREAIIDAPDGMIVTTGSPDWFIRSGSGNDAITAHSGRNVLDGGTGSNFLVGGNGEDNFFLDARGAAGPIWSTVVDPDGGGYLTFWGVSPDTHAFIWEAAQGAPGFTGLTLHALAPDRPAVSVTVAGLQANVYGSVPVEWVAHRDAASGSDYVLVVVPRVFL